MAIRSLLKELKNNNIDVHLYGEDLEINYDGDELPQLFYNRIKENKNAIIAFLKDIQKENNTENEIPVVPIREAYVTSSGQKRLWLLSQFSEGKIAYNIPGLYLFKGSLNISFLEEALKIIIDRHEILRTVFILDDKGQVMQRIKQMEEISFSLVFKNLLGEDGKNEKIRCAIQEITEYPFDLSEGPLLRVGLFQLAINEWSFAYSMHHIISDGWSKNVMINELLILYNSLVKGETPALQPLRIQYKDYASWQQDQLHNEGMNSHKEYWMTQLSGDIPVLQLPADYPRPPVKTYNGNVIGSVIDKKLSDSIKLLSQNNGATLFMGLLAAVNTLLFKYTGQNDIIVGSPVAGRDHVNLEEQIGLYINMLAFRAKFDEQDTFIDLLENIKQITLGGFEHQIYPFDELVNNLDLDRDISRSPLFDVMVVLQNTQMAVESGLRMGDLEVGFYPDGNSCISKFDLTFNFEERGDNIEMLIEYNSDLFAKGTIERLCRHFICLLENIIEQPRKPVSSLNYISSEELRGILSRNETFRISPDDTLIDIIENQADKTPDANAVVCGRKTLTYRELNENANQFASYLRTKFSVKSDDIIGLQLQRTEWMVIAILGVLKSGAAYLPLDVNYPAERIEYILNDSKVSLVINDEMLEHSSPDILQCNKNNLSHQHKPFNLAYIIYTSGSTGWPKGVMIEHKSLRSFMENLSEKFDIGPSAKMCAATNYTFDISVLELLGPLAKGGTVVVDQGSDPAFILDLIESGQINTLQVTPSRLNQFLELGTDAINTLNNLKTLLIGGEALNLNQFKLLQKATGVRVFNVYGPTETTIWSSCMEIKADANLSIGSPLLNEKIYILGPQLQPVADGIIGEVCIGGEGLARGYLNNPVLSNEKFVPNPFSPGEKIYKTGDLGKGLCDGTIEFIGRKDGQVKIRGHRIELGEIEEALRRLEFVQQVVVLIKERNGEKDLIAYLVSSQTLNIKNIREFLSKTLPEYMLPAVYIQLNKFPLTFSGKIDKNALLDSPMPDMLSGEEYIGPGNEKQEKLVLIWKKLLNRDVVGIKDNFFTLGGHSIKMMHLLFEIKNEFGIDLRIEDVFSNPTIEFISEELTRKQWALDSNSSGSEENIVLTI